MSNEKKPGWLGYICYIGDYILPSYIGILIDHYIRVHIFGDWDLGVF